MSVNEDELILVYRERLAACARRVLGDRDEAEDVAHEALLRAPRARGTSLVAWLVKLCSVPASQDPIESSADTRTK